MRSLLSEEDKDGAEAVGNRLARDESNVLESKLTAAAN